MRQPFRSVVLGILLGTPFLGSCKTPGTLPEGIIEVTATVEHVIAFEAGQRIYVERHPGDPRDLARRIASQLARWGFEVDSGGPRARLGSYDFLVTYEDRWMWDLSMYLLELRLQFFVPSADGPPLLAASGRSYRTSTARADVTVMTQEIFQAIRRENERRRASEAAGATPLVH